MRDIFINELKEISSASQRYNLLREKLQHLVLKIFADHGYFNHLCFVGGTALRVLYDLRRFSEDLDFSVDLEMARNFSFEKLLKSLENDLRSYDFKVEFKSKLEGTVKKSFIKYLNVLEPLKLASRIHEKLTVKLDIDTNPPRGYQSEISGIQKDFLLKIRHHNRPSLFAGKISAILGRRYVKGRDYYDLIWFCANKTPVNLQFLNNSIQQTQSDLPPFDLHTLKQTLQSTLESVDLTRVIEDVRPFLEDPKETHLFDRHLMVSLLKNIVIYNTSN